MARRRGQQAGGRRVAHVGAVYQQAAQHLARLQTQLLDAVLAPGQPMVPQPRTELHLLTERGRAAGAAQPAVRDVTLNVLCGEHHVRRRVEAVARPRAHPLVDVTISAVSVAEDVTQHFTPVL